ncbi:hypothetical protein D3C75_1284970 [compost metagenome]
MVKVVPQFNGERCWYSRCPVSASNTWPICPPVSSNGPNGWRKLHRLPTPVTGLLSRNSKPASPMLYCWPWALTTALMLTAGWIPSTLHWSRS